MFPPPASEPHSLVSSSLNPPLHHLPHLIDFFLTCVELDLEPISFPVLAFFPLFSLIQSIAHLAWYVTCAVLVAYCWAISHFFFQMPFEVVNFTGNIIQAPISFVSHTYYKQLMCNFPMQNLLYMAS